MIQPIKPEKRGRGRPRKEIKKTAPITIWVEPYLKSLYMRKGISPEDLREFIKRYNPKDPDAAYETEPAINSNDWEKLAKIISQVPSLVLYGKIGAGKTTLVKTLVSMDKSRIYLILDPHNEYGDINIPEIRKISRDIKTSSRIVLPKINEASIQHFIVIKNIILSAPFQNSVTLVIDEAPKFADVGLKNLLMESRKFVSVLAIAQEKLYDFCDSIKVKPYKTIDIKKMMGE